MLPFAWKLSLVGSVAGGPRLAAVLVALIPWLPALAAEPARRPNIIFILADDKD